VVLIVSDVHGAFEALARVARSGEVLLVLGDLINLMDYRTGEGIIADVMGGDFGVRVSQRRAESDYPGMRALWRERSDGRQEEISSRIGDLVEAQYSLCREALTGGKGYVTFGNVDRPELLARSLPEGMVFVDGDVVEIDGVSFGFVGGGVATPVNAAGEVGDDEMAAKLETMGAVDVLCSHLPPAVPALRTDVVTGRHERASQPILDYLRRHRPRRHFFGDVHQPQATTWRVGPTVCQNVGYFRATRRPVRFDPADGR
jgi:Icc-related predicted phosphoesterase